MFKNANAPLHSFEIGICLLARLDDRTDAVCSRVQAGLAFDESWDARLIRHMVENLDQNLCNKILCNEDADPTV